MKKYLQSFANKESFNQAIKVGLVGVLNTVVFLILLNVFLTVGLSPLWSITVAFALTTFMSYLLNRRWTFALKDGRVSGRETVSFFIVNTVAYLVTLGIVWLAGVLLGPLDRIGTNVASIFAAGLLILPKLAGYRDVVFSKALSEDRGQEFDGRSSIIDHRPDTP